MPGGYPLESTLLRQLRFLQAAVGILFVVTVALCVNLRYPFISQRIDVLDAEKINIREKDGTLKAVLSNSAGFTAMGGDRAKQPGGVPFSGLLFYNQQGDEEGGLVYSGRAIPGGQDADVTLTFDQYRQDQNIYLHHEEHKDAQARSIDDGLTIISRPDRADVKEEYATYAALEKLSGEQRDALQLKSLQEGKISTRRLFVGDRRGVKDGAAYDDAGVFIKNRWGRDAMKLYVDYDNKPHLEVYDQLGKSVVYELKLPN
jgi:hypothetical protein